MTEKEKQLFEIAQLQCDRCRTDGICILDNLECDGSCWWYMNAEKHYKKGLRKVPEGAVVLTKEEYEQIKQEYVELKHKVREMYTWEQMEQTRKETVKEFLFKVESYLAYDNDDDLFTKKALLLTIADVAKEEFSVEVQE